MQTNSNNPAQLIVYSSLNINDSKLFGEIFTKIDDPLKQLAVFEKIQEIQYIQYKRNIEIQNTAIMNSNLPFISGWMALLGIPIGYFIAHLIILFGFKSVPSVTVGAVAGGAVGARNWIMKNLFNINSINSASTAANNATSSVSRFMDSLIPTEMYNCIIGACILASICFTYYMIHCMNVARANARK